MSSVGNGVIGGGEDLAPLYRAEKEARERRYVQEREALDRGMRFVGERSIAREAESMSVPARLASIESLLARLVAAIEKISAAGVD